MTKLHVVRPDPKLVIWLDPGKMTGWAMFEDMVTFSSGQADFDGIDDMINMWCGLMRDELWLGWERYLVTQGGGRSGSPEYSLEVIGATKSACRRNNVTVLQPMPSASRKLGDDLKLQRLGWRQPGMRHANDAANHLLAWLLREKRLPTHLTQKLFTPG